MSSNFQVLGGDGPFDFSFWCFIFGVFIFVSRVCVSLAVSSLFPLRLACYVWAHLLSTLNLDLGLSPADISLGVFHLEFSLSSFASYPWISSRTFLVWISPLRVPKPNVVYGHRVFFVYQVSFHDLLLESSQIILVLFRLFFVWNMFSHRALEICSWDMCGAFSMVSSAFFIRGYPFHRCSYPTFRPYIPPAEP